MSEEKERKQTVNKPIPVLKKDTTFGPKVGPPVDVGPDADITPITRQEIKKVKATDWVDLNLTQLHEQMDTMQNRLHYAQTIGHQDMINQLSRGIIQLQLIIKTKADQEHKLI